VNPAPSELSLFVGRFHPLLVHLPIGILVLLAALEALALIPRFKQANASRAWALAMAVPAAIASAGAGWLLAASGDYDPQLLAWHRWLGIATAALVTLAGLALATRHPRTYRGFLFAGLAATSLAGHLGGSLTHGRDYLTRYAPAPLRRLLGRLAGEPAQATGTSGNLGRAEGGGSDGLQTQGAFSGVIQPILAQYCAACHGPEKAKAGLRLDTFAALTKGAAHGPVILPGNAMNSVLIRLMTLPMDDDAHMPPSGKPQPTADDIALLRWWIDVGAPANRSVADLKPPPAILNLLKARAGANASSQTATNATPAPRVAEASPKPPDEIRPVAQPLGDELGIVLSALAPDEPWWQANASLAGTNFTDAALDRLAPVLPNLRWLDLAGTAVTDNGLARLANAPHLTRLHLERTGVTDAGLASLTGLGELEYLNLYATRVTDAGLDHLRLLPNLRRLYLWQTPVTPDAARAFAATRTDTNQIQRWQDQILQLQAQIRRARVIVELGTNLPSSPATNPPTATATNAPASASPRTAPATATPEPDPGPGSLSKGTFGHQDRVGRSLRVGNPGRHSGVCGHTAARAKTV
jgi:uncharacterized membrane protein